MGFWKRKTAEEKSSGEPVEVAIIPNTVLSEIYQDMLRENEIPFVCRQQGAAGYLKILTGGLLAADSIYVNERDYERARELYEIYVEGENYSEVLADEED